MRCPLIPSYDVPVCRMVNCKYYNVATGSRCLMRDTRLAAGDNISDSELILYKSPTMTQEDMIKYRKEVINKSHTVVLFNAIVEKVREHCEPSGGFNHSMSKKMPSQCISVVKKILKSNVYNNEFIGAEPWMIGYIFHPSELDGVPSKFSLATLFGLTQREYKILVSTISELRN